MAWRVLWDRPTAVTGVAMSSRGVYCGIGLLPLQGWPCRAVACTAGWPCRGVYCGIGLLPLQGWPCRAAACTVG